MISSFPLGNTAWRALWPDALPEDFQSPLPDVPWKGQVARHRRLLQAMAHVPGVSCGALEASDLLRKMEEWTLRHSAHMSIPPTMEGWSRAVWATLSEPNGKEDMAWLWAGYASSVQQALRAPPVQPAWVTAFLEGVRPAVHEEQALPAPAAVVGPEDRRANDTARKIPPRPAARPAPPPTPEVATLHAWLVEVLGELGRSNEPHGILVEKLDQRIKEQVAEKAQPGPRRMSGWMEFMLLPAISLLDAQKMEALADLWPPHQATSFIDPQKTLSGKRFWGIVDGVANSSARQTLFSRLLPALIDSSQWSSGLRHGIAISMLEWTSSRPEAFEERLGLWRAWGGKMEDAPAKAAPAAGVFGQSQQVPETVGQWIASKNNKSWDAVVEKLPASPRRSAPTP